MKNKNKNDQHFENNRISYKCIDIFMVVNYDKKIIDDYLIKLYDNINNNS